MHYIQPLSGKPTAFEILKALTSDLLQDKEMKKTKEWVSEWTNEKFHCVLRFNFHI